MQLVYALTEEESAFADGIIHEMPSSLKALDSELQRLRRFRVLEIRFQNFCELYKMGTFPPLSWPDGAELLRRYRVKISKEIPLSSAEMQFVEGEITDHGINTDEFDFETRMDKIKGKMAERHANLRERIATKWMFLLRHGAYSEIPSSLIVALSQMSAGPKPKSRKKSVQKVYRKKLAAANLRPCSKRHWKFRKAFIIGWLEKETIPSLKNLLAGKSTTQQQSEPIEYKMAA